jgi:CO dehydrogenase/acetyl-CoA synthase alpha subunit
MPQPLPPENRRNGSKAIHYRELRKRMNKMERPEWKEWFKQCMMELPKDKQIWEWLNREARWKPKGRGKYGKRIGRPLDIKANTPDTRNMDWDEL